jgi:hypothetical protein
LTKVSSQICFALLLRHDTNSIKQQVKCRRHAMRRRCAAKVRVQACPLPRPNLACSGVRVHVL